MFGWLFSKFNNAFVFPDPEPPIINMVIFRYGLIIYIINN